jgi:signal transduction histidine kinase
MRNIWRPWFACALAALFCIATPGATQASHQPDHRGAERQVLLLLPSDTAFPWTTNLSGALRAKLEMAEESVVVYTEQIDMSRLGERDYPARLKSWLALKYRETPLDLIFAPGPAPTQFLERFAPEAWHGVPLVVLVNLQLSGMPRLPGPATGFVVYYDVGGTVADALAMLPDTKRIALVYGAADYEIARYRRFEKEVRAATPLELIDLGALRFAELLKRVSELPADTIVLFLGFQMDADGRNFLPDRALAAIAKASNRPVFSLYEPLLGRGIVGGRLANFEAVGTAMAQKGLEILAGEPAESIPFTRSDFTSGVYDWRELQRWGIPRHAVPAGAEIRYEEATVWQQYRWVILAVAAALLAQAALIAALLLERERRRRAEAHARRTFGHIAHYDRVAAMGELATSLAHELNQPLAAILANAQAARNVLQTAHPDLREVRESLDDIVDDDKRAGEVIRRMRALLKKEEFRPEPIDLNQTVRDVLRLLAQDAARRGVTVIADLQPGLPPVQGDSVQLQQVLLNLLVNAFDAVTGQSSERRRVTVRTFHIASGMVELDVQDEGEGIVAKHVSRLFEPFFTTKRDGLGMGLSIVRSILELHGGRIEAENVPGSGARFRCLLPPMLIPA